MPDFESVLNDARQLSAEDQLRLIEVISAEVPDSHAVSLHPEWIEEIRHRVAEIKAGNVKTTPAEVVHARLMERVNRGEKG